jgi:hypothetical protein
MSRLTNELRVIPKPAWIVALFIYAASTIPMFFLVTPGDADIGRWARWEQAFFVFGMFLFVVPPVALIGYVYGDARRRRMRYVMWTLLATFIPFGVGMILYFILRDPLPKLCPGCRNEATKGLPFCPYCGTPLESRCWNCGKSVDLGWANCGHCGQRLHALTPQATQDQGLAT